MAVRVGDTFYGTPPNQGASLVGEAFGDMNQGFERIEIFLDRLAGLMHEHGIDKVDVAWTHKDPA